MNLQDWKNNSSRRESFSEAIDALDRARDLLRHDSPVGVSPACPLKLRLVELKQWRQGIGRSPRKPPQAFEEIGVLYHPKAPLLAGPSRRPWHRHALQHQTKSPESIQGCCENVDLGDPMPPLFRNERSPLCANPAAEVHCQGTYEH